MIDPRPQASPDSGPLLQLTVELARLTITPAEVASMEVGQVFALAPDAEAALELRVDGRLVGRGALVELDGLPGVRLVALAPPGEGSPR
jgi:flagellar motor switch protein FliM